MKNVLVISNLFWTQTNVFEHGQNGCLGIFKNIWLLSKMIDSGIFFLIRSKKIWTSISGFTKYWWNSHTNILSWKFNWRHLVSVLHSSHYVVDLNLCNFPIKWGIHVDWSWCRGGVWPGKNHKYFIKRKLDIKFQIFFSFQYFGSKNSLWY